MLAACFGRKALSARLLQELASNGDVAARTTGARRHEQHVTIRENFWISLCKYSVRKRFKHKFLLRPFLKGRRKLEGCGSFMANPDALFRQFRQPCPPDGQQSHTPAAPVS